MRTCPLGWMSTEPECPHLALSGQGSQFLGPQAQGSSSQGSRGWTGLVRTCGQCPLPLPQEMIPFAVVGSDHEYQVNGKRILGRKTKWGTIEGNRQAGTWGFQTNHKEKAASADRDYASGPELGAQHLICCIATQPPG